MARNVGEVFVTVLANTKVFEEQVEKAARDAAKEAGAQIDTRLTDAFRNAAQKWSRDTRLRTLADQTGAQIARRFGLGFDKGIERVRLTDTVGKELKALAQESGEAFEDLLDQVVQRIGPAYERELRAIVTEAEAENRRIDAQRAADDRQAQRARQQAEQSLARQIEQTGRLRNRTDQVAQAQLAIAKARDFSLELANTELRVYQEQEQALKRSLRVLQRNQDVIATIDRDLFLSAQDAADRDPFRGVTNGLFRLRRSLRRAGTGGVFDTITNILGAGVGLVGTFSRLGSAIGRFPVKGLLNISEAIQSLASAGAIKSTGLIAQLGAGIARFAPIISKFTAVLAPFGAAVGIVSGLGVVTKIVGVFASALTSAAGILTLFVQQLTFAAGSLAAFLPLIAALPPVAAAIVTGFRGVPDAIGAFNDVLNASDPEEKAEALEKYNEALGNLAPNAADAVRALEPVIERFREVQTIVQDKLFEGLDQEIRDLDDTFKIVERGLQDTADTLNGVFKSISEELQTDAFRRDFEGVFTGLQPIIADLGNAVGDFFAGLTGLIDALLPAGKELSGTIADLAEDFKEFTQSAEGKTAIQDFLDEAFESARLLKDIFLEVAGAIGGIFGAANEPGQGFLKDVLERAERFNQWVQERVADGSLERWFEDIRDIGNELFDVIGKVVGVIDRLDTPENREALKNLLQGFEDFLAFVTDEFIPAMEAVWDWLEPARDAVGEFIDPLIDGFQGLIDFINGEGWQGLITTIIAPFRSLIGALSEIPGLGGVLQPVKQALDGLVENIQNPLPDYNWPQQLQDKLSDIFVQGGLTESQIELLTQARTLPEWPDELTGALSLLELSGQLTRDEIAQITGDKPLPSWPDRYKALMQELKASGALTSEQLDLVAAIRSSGGDWLPAMEAFLKGVDSTGNLTAQELDKVAEKRANGGDWLGALRRFLADADTTAEGTESELDDVARKRSADGWVRTLSGALDTATGDAQGTKGAIDKIPTNKRTDIRVTDNGSTAGVQGAINGLRGRTITIVARLQRTAALQAAIGGSLAGDQSGLRGGASGGLFTGPTPMLIGEAGPEALVPLARPLAQVDPAVRDMAAVLRGLKPSPAGDAAPKKVVNVTLNVQPVQADPEAVAESVMNRAVALARG